MNSAKNLQNLICANSKMHSYNNIASKFLNYVTFFRDLLDVSSG
jgi:hypothetical protein